MSAPSLPAAAFGRLRITVPEHISSLFPIGARALERPFARLERLPVSGPPFQGQRSRPAPCTPCDAFPGPVRPVAPSLSSSEIDASSPLPASGIASPATSRISAPLWGAFVPLRIEAFNPTHGRKAHLAKRPIPLRSPKPGLFLNPASDHRSEFRYASLGLLSLEPLGTISIFDESAVTVKRNRTRRERFSSRNSTCFFNELAARVVSGV